LCPDECMPDGKTADFPIALGMPGLAQVAAARKLLLARCLGRAVSCVS